jgi:hypothetical protein
MNDMLNLAIAGVVVCLTFLWITLLSLGPFVIIGWVIYKCAQMFSGAA